jgi:hypothetical protein
VVQLPCSDDQFVCEASVMLPAHHLHSNVYCNESLMCASPVEATLYACGQSVLHAELVGLSEQVCSSCGPVVLSE